MSHPCQETGVHLTIAQNEHRLIIKIVSYVHCNHQFA